jgi:hypothetical protein
MNEDLLEPPSFFDDDDIEMLSSSDHHPLPNQANPEPITGGSRLFL